MEYCKWHTNKAYTEKQYEKAKSCRFDGPYQGADDGLIRVYCFKAIDEVKNSRKFKCPAERKKNGLHSTQTN